MHSVWQDNTHRSIVLVHVCNKTGISMALHNLCCIPESNAAVCQTTRQNSILQAKAASGTHSTIYMQTIQKAELMATHCFMSGVRGSQEPPLSCTCPMRVDGSCQEQSRASQQMLFLVPLQSPTKIPELHQRNVAEGVHFPLMHIGSSILLLNSQGMKQD